jgi:predicted nucleic acid-binding protein
VKVAFVDTLYFVALFNPRDQWHERAIAAAESLTDCISMHAMRERNVSDILTHDDHFPQEGFTVLL